MKPGGGKQKGSSFERQICVKLSLWISHGKRQDLLWRSAMSGGRATVQRRKGIANAQGGDITAVDPAGHRLTDVFSIECKAVKSLDLTSGLLKGNGAFIKFWAQAQHDADDKFAMLIAHQNQMPTIIAIPRDAARHYLPRLPTARISVWLGGEPLNIYLFDDFVKVKCPL